MRILLLVLCLTASAAYGQISGAGQIGCTAAPVTGTGWTTATSVNATQVLATNVAGAQVLVMLDQGTTLTVGAVQFQGDPGDGTFINLAAWQVVDPTTPPFATISQPYTLQASTNKQFLIQMAGMYRLQLKLTTAITGTATVTPYTTIACYALPMLNYQASASNFNSTVIGAGTAGTANAGVETVQGIAGMTKLLVTPDANVKVDVVGNAGATLDTAPQATAPTNILAVGAAAVNAEQTAATNGQAQRIVTDLVGKLIALPYANPENYIQGTTGAQTGSTVISVIASAGGSLRNYITSCQITNTSATNTFMQITDGASTVMTTIPMPANGGAVINFPSPLKGTAATATEALPGAGVTSWYVSCQGYKGL